MGSFLTQPGQWPVIEDPHLRSPEAERLLAYLPPQEQVMLGHVLDCGACQQLLLQSLGPPPARVAALARPRADYSGIWAGLVASAEEAAVRVAAESEAAEAAIAELLPLTNEERWKRIGEQARLRSVAIANLLLNQSFGTARNNPAEAENLALLAVSMLAQLEPDHAPGQLVLELKARGWALVAHACWIAGEWPGVREALEHAEDALVEAGYPAKQLGFRRVMAAFRLTERRIEQSFNLLTGAVELLVASLLPEPGAAREGAGKTEN